MKFLFSVYNNNNDNKNNNLGQVFEQAKQRLDCFSF